MKISYLAIDKKKIILKQGLLFAKVSSLQDTIQGELNYYELNLAGIEACGSKLSLSQYHNITLLCVNVKCDEDKMAPFCKKCVN